MTAHFEGKLHAFRRTQDGVVISYVVHPDDVSAAMATAALGTRYMIGFAEIGEDGKPVKEVVKPAPVQPQKERAAFVSLPFSQQAALKCKDADFQQYMVERYSGPHAYRPTEENAVVMLKERCGIKSRAELDDTRNDWPRHYWNEILGGYQDWLTTQRYASVAR